MQRAGGYWHMLPEAAQARKAVWEAVNPHTGKRRIDEAFPKSIRAATRENDMFIRFVNGSTWQVVGSDNFDSLVGSPPVGVVFSEYALADPNAWAMLRPILMENNGWAAFISTPRGPNHFKRLLELARSSDDWFGEALRADQTGVFTAEQLEAERREYIAEWGEEAGQNLFEQEYLVSFDAALPGTYYAKLIRNAETGERITSVPWESKVPVWTAWDLGMGDSTAIWFAQAVGNEIRLIDYYEASGVGLDHYARILKDKPYVYERHLLPHDGDVKELGTGRSRREVLESLGLKTEIVKNLSVDDGINAVRTILPRCWFDAKKCERGIEALRQYRRDYDEKLKAFRARPLHDWTSHAADAMRYLALGLPDRAVRKVAAPKINTRWVV